MKSGLLGKSIAVIALCSISQLSLADDASAAKTIAGIVEHLNHFPSAAEKEVLMVISGDSANSAAVKSIAMAVHDMQHSASADAKAQLAVIAADQGVSDSIRSLAEIVSGINHMPSADAKAKLQAMM